MNDNVLENVYEAIQVFWIPMVTGGALIGLCMLGFGLFKLASSLRHPGSGNRYCVVGLCVGGFLLLNISELFSILSLSLLGDSGDFSFAASVATGGPGEMYIKVAVSSIKLIGLFGLIRGCYLLSKNTEGGGVVGAIIHCVGGTLALNIETFAILLANVVGGTFGETVKSLFVS